MYVYVQMYMYRCICIDAYVCVYAYVNRYASIYLSIYINIYACTQPVNLCTLDLISFGRFFPAQCDSAAWKACRVCVAACSCLSLDLSRSVCKVYRGQGRGACGRIR